MSDEELFEVLRNRGVILPMIDYENLNMNMNVIEQLYKTLTNEIKINMEIQDEGDDFQQGRTHGYLTALIKTRVFLKERVFAYE